MKTEAVKNIRIKDSKVEVSPMEEPKIDNNVESVVHATLVYNNHLKAMDAFNASFLEVENENILFDGEYIYIDFNRQGSVKFPQKDGIYPAPDNMFLHNEMLKISGDKEDTQSSDDAYNEMLKEEQHTEGVKVEAEPTKPDFVQKVLDLWESHFSCTCSDLTCEAKGTTHKAAKAIVDTFVTPLQEENRKLKEEIKSEKYWAVEKQLELTSNFNSLLGAEVEERDAKIQSLEDQLRQAREQLSYYADKNQNQ